MIAELAVYRLLCMVYSTGGMSVGQVYGHCECDITWTMGHRD